MTDADQALWFALRDRRLAGFKFKSQWSLGPFVADFCCLSARLVVEADGGQHDEVADAPRTAWLTAHGFRVLRFWNNDVLTNMDGVPQVILAELEKEQDPHPSPLPRTGEGA
jgi:adenine-specific DNA-methyltransferase